MRFNEIVNESEDSVIAALKRTMQLMRASSKGGTWRDITPAHGGYSFEVRDWGSWQVPDGEEDDGDYDWEELTPGSVAKLREISTTVGSEFPSVNLSISPEEKNWIVVSASPKVN